MDPSTAPTTLATHNTTTSIYEGDATTSTPSVITAASAPASASQQWEERILVVRRHFERKGYRVHSGLQFGCELVLYADDPSKVHSDFCVHVVPADGSIDWRSMQTLARSMPDLHKTLILACPRPEDHTTRCDPKDIVWVVDELALATEHAPFRHRKTATVHKHGTVVVGTQVKRSKTSDT